MFNLDRVFFYNKARMNFQAFALRDMGMGIREGCRGMSKDELSL